MKKMAIYENLQHQQQYHHNSSSCHYHHYRFEQPQQQEEEEPNYVCAREIRDRKRFGISVADNQLTNFIDLVSSPLSVYLSCGNKFTYII